MAKKIEKPKLLELLRVLEYSQKTIIVDLSNLDEAPVFTIKELIDSGKLIKFRADDIVEKVCVKEDIIIIYVDIIKQRQIEREIRRWKTLQ